MHLKTLIRATLTEAYPGPKEPVALRVWDYTHDYPWGPLRGETQKILQAKNDAIWSALDRAPVTDLAYSSLTSLETDVYPDRVQHYQDNPAKDLPMVIKHAGLFVLWDGTHRVEAALRSGRDHGPVRLADLDAILTPEGRLRG
jgi:hypothetical protein